MEKRMVDAIGLPCPAPVVKAARALEEMGGSGALEVLVDNDVAVQNLLRLAAGRKLTARTAERAEGVYAVTLETTGETAPAAQAPAPAPQASQVRRGFVVAVESAAMGRGDETLGKSLLKGFLFAISQLPQLPETVLFYNGGAHLTTENSDSLEDLRGMESRGTVIRTCGTCLNFYGLTDRLAVGDVTNMYDIVETLAAAETVVKP